MSQFSKVTVDSASRKKSPFPLGGKVSTSLQFGEVMPVHCRKLTPNSSSTVNVRSLVRLDPMVAPTSQGVIKCKQWHSFVGYSDLFRHWAAYQTGKPISGSNGLITFNKLPSMRHLDLSIMCLIGAKITPYVRNNVETDANKTVWRKYSDPNNTDVARLFNVLSQAYPNFISDYENYDIFNARFPNFTLQNANYHFDARFLGLPVTGAGKAYLPLGNVGYTANSRSTLFFGADVDIAHCDFVFYNKVTNDDEDFYFAFAVNMSNYGARIFDILNIIGIGVDFANTDIVDVTRLFATYLSYYGSFGLTKYTNYEQSNCNAFLKAYENGGNNFSLLDWTSSLNVPFGNAAYLNDLFVRFITDLATAYVTDAVDYVASHRRTDVICNDELGWVQNIVVAPDNVSEPNGAFGQTNATHPNGVKASTNSVFINKVSHTQVDAQILQILWKNTNRQSVAGQELEKLLRAGGYGAYCDQQQSHFLGYYEFDIDVTDINATSDSVNTVTGKNSTLGQYVGKGIGAAKDPKSFTFETDEGGYWITLCAIVPDSDYCQGNDQTVYDIERTDQYQREFDSQGYELERRSVVKIGADVVDPRNTSASQLPFGYEPRMMRYKVGRSCLAGNFRRRSTRDQYLPFVLSRWLDVDDIYEIREPIPYDGYKDFYVKNTQALNDTPIAGDAWRYINLYPWLSNFERIFAFDDKVRGAWLSPQLFQRYIYCGERYDYFMLFLTVAHSCRAEMLPTYDSWSTTDDNDGNGKTMEQS